MKDREYKGDSIYFRIVRLMIFAFIVAVLFFLLISHAGDAAITSYAERTNYEERENLKRSEALQEYVEENQISATDFHSLEAWVRTQSVVWLQVYRDHRLLYDSQYEEMSGNPSYEESEEEVPQEFCYQIHFQDGDAVVHLYGMYLYQIYSYALVGEIFLSFLLFTGIVMAGIYRYVKYIRKLSGEIGILEGGDLDFEITVWGKDELALLAKGLDDMRKSIRQQFIQEEELWKLNQEMITSLSHDLRTPLTSLLIYLEILRKNGYSDMDTFRKCLDKIDAKAHQMKEMADHILNYSMGRGESGPKMEQPKPFQTVFYDEISEMCAYLEQNGYETQPELEWKPWKIRVDSDYITRILDNITSNIVKYADKEKAVRIKTGYTDEYGMLIFENTKNGETGKTESTNIGVKSIRGMMEEMGGFCMTEESKETYKIVLLFKKSG